MLLTGIFPALTTPFYADGRLYLKKLEHNVDRYSRTPIAGMAILGSTGEVVMLSEEEQREVLRVAVEVPRRRRSCWPVSGTSRQSRRWKLQSMLRS